MKNMNKLYQQHILDRFHYPRHKGELTGSHCRSSTLSNPSCGDRITMYACIENNDDGIPHIVQASFTGAGCILCLAAADLLLSAIHHREVKRIQEFSDKDMRDLVGIDPGHTRMKCIMLPLDTLQALLKDA